MQSHSVKIWLTKLLPRYFSMSKTSRAAFASQPAPKRVGVNFDNSLRRATDAERQGTNANETPDPDPNTTNVHAARGSGTLQKQMRVSVWIQKVSTLLN